MELTIGKRIMENRKRLGLTQDALAEKLGVTAQAVSKWENDQSCPDISMLPKLTEIFGITTDELLGREQNTVVHEAEVVQEEEEENGGIHIQKGGWEFHWDSGRRNALTFAVLVLLFGGLMLAAKILHWDVSWWNILWPSVLIVYGLRGVFRKFSFFGLGCALFGGYFLIENLGIWKLDIGSELIFPIIVVIFGVSLLVDALRKPRKPRFHILRNGKKYVSGNKETESSFSTEENSFECRLSFGENTHYIDITLLESGDISCSFGELTVDLSGCQTVTNDCQLDANCSFGHLNLLVPKRFRVEPDSRTFFASVDIEGSPDPNPTGIIRLDANVSFGEIQIQYI